MIIYQILSIFAVKPPIFPFFHGSRTPDRRQSAAPNVGNVAARSVLQQLGAVGKGRMEKLRATPLAALPKRYGSAA